MDTPINKAHFYARKSFQYIGNNKIKYIEQAIENFQLALTQSSNPKAIDSIELQIRYYEKQLKLLNARKALCQKSEKSMRNADEDLSFLSVNEHIDKSTDFQLDLLKNLEDSYNVIKELSSIDNEQISPQVTQLQNLNSQLNVMFHELANEVEKVLNENEILRDKVNKITDNSKAGETSKHDEGRRNINEIIEHRDSDDSSPCEEIQDLPPLELPSFNLDSLDDK